MFLICDGLVYVQFWDMGGIWSHVDTIIILEVLVNHVPHIARYLPEHQGHYNYFK